MVSIPKIIGVMSCSFVLCLSLSNVTQAADKMEVDPCADRKGGEPNLVKCNEEARQGIHTIKGEVLRIDGNDFLIQRYDGKEVSLRVDSATETSGRIGRGDRIEAKVREVNDEKRVLSLRQVEK
jgi:hypothetical protein